MKILILLFSLLFVSPKKEPIIYSPPETFYTKNGKHLIAIKLNDSTYVEVHIDINVPSDTFYLNQKYKKI